MKKLILFSVVLATQIHGQLAVQKERLGGIGGADTLMDVTRRGDEADSMKVLRERESGDMEKYAFLTTIQDFMGNDIAEWDGMRFISTNDPSGKVVLFSNNPADLFLIGMPINENIPAEKWFFVAGQYANYGYLHITNINIPPVVDNMDVGPAFGIYFNERCWHVFDEFGWSDPPPINLYYQWRLPFEVRERPVIVPVYDPVAALTDLVPPHDFTDVVTGNIYTVIVSNASFYAILKPTPKE